MIRCGGFANAGMNGRRLCIFEAMALAVHVAVEGVRVIGIYYSFRIIYQKYFKKYIKKFSKIYIKSFKEVADIYNSRFGYFLLGKSSIDKVFGRRLMNMYTLFPRRLFTSSGAQPFCFANSMSTISKLSVRLFPNCSIPTLSLLIFYY